MRIIWTGSTTLALLLLVIGLATVAVAQGPPAHPEPEMVEGYCGDHHVMDDGTVFLNGVVTEGGVLTYELETADDESADMLSTVLNQLARAGGKLCVDGEIWPGDEQTLTVTYAYAQG